MKIIQISKIKKPSLAALAVLFSGLSGAILPATASAGTLFEPDSTPAYSASGCLNTTSTDWTGAVTTPELTFTGQPYDVAPGGRTRVPDTGSITFTRSDGVTGVLTQASDNSSPAYSGYFSNYTSGVGYYISSAAEPATANALPGYSPAIHQSTNGFKSSLKFSEPINGLDFSMSDMDSGNTWVDKAIVRAKIKGSSVPITVYSGTDVTKASASDNGYELTSSAMASLNDDSPNGAAVVSIAGWLDEVSIEYLPFLDSSTAGGAPGVLVVLSNTCPPIGVAKSVSDVTNNKDGTSSFSYTVVAKNSSNDDLYDLMLTDKLPFKESEVKSVSLDAGPGLSDDQLNSNYDGYSEENMLGSGVMLAAGASAKLTINVTLDTGFTAGTYENSVTASGAVAEGSSMRVSDVSDDGAEPDPSNDNDEGGVNDNTPLVLAANTSRLPEEEAPGVPDTGTAPLASRAIILVPTVLTGLVLLSAAYKYKFRR